MYILFQDNSQESVSRSTRPVDPSTGSVVGQSPRFYGDLIYLYGYDQLRSKVFEDGFICRRNIPLKFLWAPTVTGERNPSKHYVCISTVVDFKTLFISYHIERINDVCS